MDGTTAKGSPGDGDDGEAPWHDQTLPMAERMKLADGRPLRRRMMAAMAQQDCGQCGYNCNDYSHGIIGNRTLRDVLTHDISLAPAPDSLFQLYSYLTGGERRQKARALAAGEDPDGDAAALDVLAAMEKFAGVRPDPEAFIEALEPLQPRLYSIASSPQVEPGRVALTVDTVPYDIDGR